MLFLFGCGSHQDDSKAEKVLNISIKTIELSHYEDDSLNNIRPYVIPRIYYVFEYENNSTERVDLNLLSHFNTEDKMRGELFVLFQHDKEIDTLYFTDYESVNPVPMEAKTNSEFTIGIPISNFLENEEFQSKTPLFLMKLIAENGKVIYRNPNTVDNNVYKSQVINKSKDFNILFRNPDDTAIE